ncbi:hypothetical protein [Haloplanus halophilus]|uniref:hypothetical protein n=1 Tax=Haloplanus halophilus TaxID=2949993 RepID=UPI00203B804F|nr:hypothetical protein [Haloplanus sp. GDY1]
MFTVHHQSVFVIDSDSGSETNAKSKTKTVDEHGLLALDDEPFETTLFHHGVDVDTRQRTSRIETGGSDEFIDDRPLSAIRSGRSNPDSLKTAPGLQGTLFADTALDQRTLNGDQANARFMFEVEQRRQHEQDNDDEA